MDTRSQASSSVKEFLLQNRENFEESLLDEAINVRDKIDHIQAVGNINLLDNAHKLVLFIVEERVEELTDFAKQEGIVWAKFQMTLAFKLEWIQAIRRTLWAFLYQYDLKHQNPVDREQFYATERNVNDLIDAFFTSFFISYSKFKDELLDQQRKLVENLSVPVIPINQEICVLPLIGTIDSDRILTIQEKVLQEIERHHIETLIFDLSGITPIDEDITFELQKTIQSISMMGCRTVLTGMRAEIVKGMVNTGGDSLSNYARFKGTLESALDEVLKH